jgi:hypothetical protein
MLLIDELNGHFCMRRDSRFGVVDLAMCVASFSFIVGMLVPAHPASSTIRPANATTAAATTAIGTTLSRLAAPR